MITFVVIAIVMVAIALAWVVVPLLRHRHRASVGREASNVAILRDQLKELESDYAGGAVAREQYEQAKRELEQRVLEESAPAQVATPAASTHAGWRTAIAVAAVVPAAALVLYVLWGDHAAFSPETQVAAQQEHDLSPAQVNAMVEKLVAKLKNEPGNVEGWVILARTYYAMGRYSEAVPAFERATALAPDDAPLLADYADALGAMQKSLQGKPTELVTKALQVDPTYWKALALAGTAAFDRKDFKQAVTYWEDLKKVIPPGVDMSKSLDSSIAEARQLAGMPAAAPEPATATAPASSPAAAMAAAAGEHRRRPREGRVEREGRRRREAQSRARRQGIAERHGVHLRPSGRRLAHAARDPAGAR